VLRALADQRAYGLNWVTIAITIALVDSRDEVNWNIDAVDVLIRSSLINLYEYDKYLAAAMESGHNGSVINFAMMLAKIYLIDDRSNANIIQSNLYGTNEVLSEIANHLRSPSDGLVQLVDTAQLHSRIQQARSPRAAGED